MILDAFGHDGQAEGMRQADRGAHNGRVVVVAGDMRDKGLVDLQLVDRQTLEVGQRRIAGAEVVDRHADAHRTQAPQHVHGARGVGHQAAFGDLDHQP